MLAAIGALDPSEVEFVAIGPPEGRLADTLRDRGIEHIGLQVFGSDMKRLPRETILPELKERIDFIKPNVLHANSLSMSVLAGLLEIPIPRVGHMRDIISLSKNAMRVLNQNDLLIAVSEATREYHLSQGLDEVKSRVIYNGIDRAAFTSGNSGSQIRSELGLPDNSMLALTVGQIGLRKGLDVLVRAAISIASKLPELHFLIVGEQNSAKAETVAYHSELLDAIATADLQDRIHWLGYRNDVPQLMGESTMLVHAAHQEPLGRVLLEAAAAGLPIVATDVGGTSEIVENKTSARLVPKGDHNELAIGIWELATDQDLRARFAAAARAHVESKFDIQQSASALLNAWRLFLI